MSAIRRFIRNPRARRGLAATAVVLSMGGLVLHRSGPAAATPVAAPHVPAGTNGTSFAALGAHGSLALSHGKVAVGQDQRIFAQLRLKADEGPGSEVRAPLALAIMLDTSGSMDGAKIQQAKQSVVRLLQQMHPDDQVALVQYDSSARLVQPLARVGDVREGLIARVGQLDAGGGTNIADAMSMGKLALGLADARRVRRMVLVSDGLDDTFARSRSIASDSMESGVTVSTLGVGLDFDESYMAGLARAGRGNFGFVRDAEALARFLERELKETSKTTVTAAVARLGLPAGVRLVRAIGAEAQAVDGRVELRLGSLYAGDEQRVVLELSVRPDSVAEPLAITAQLAWQVVGQQRVSLALAPLGLVATATPAEAAASIDHAVWATSLSAVASARQLEAVQAYNRGDAATANRLFAQNIAELEGARQDAPAEVAAGLGRQAGSYAATQKELSAAPPSAPRAKAAAKKSAEVNNSNIFRSTF